MQTELWNCEECQQEYNLSERIPKKLSLDSEKTLCLVCLKEYLNKKNPTSSSVLDITPPDSFPSDQVILIALQNRLQGAPNSCSKHLKPIHYICLKDESTACEACYKDCAKRKHKIKEITKVKKEAAKKKEELVHLLDIYGASKRSLIDIVSNEKEAISTQVEQIFNSFRKRLELKQKEFEKDIEKFFNEQDAYANQVLLEQDKAQKKQIRANIEILDSDTFNSKYFKALKQKFPNFLLPNKIKSLQSVIPLYDDHLEEIDKNFKKYLETIKPFSFEEVIESLEEEKPLVEMQVEDATAEDSQGQEEEYGDAHEMFEEIDSDIERVKSLFHAEMVEDRLVLELRDNLEKKPEILFDEKRLKALTKLELNITRSENQTEVIEGLDFIWNDFDNVVDLKVMITDRGNAKKILAQMVENDAWATEKIESFVIELIECDITDHNLNKLFTETLPKMANIKTLEIELEHTGITDKSLQSFVESSLPQLAKLEELKLFADDTKITDKGVTTLFSGLNKVQKLTGISLGLDSTRITDKSLNEFAKSVAPKFQGLKSFDLSFVSTSISDEGIQTLFTSLKGKVDDITSFVLDLGESEVTDEGLEVFATQLLPEMRSLETLELFLNDNNIKDQLIQKTALALVNAPFIKKICLELCGLQLSGECLEAIAEFALKNKPALESLRLFIANTPLTNVELTNFFHKIYPCVEKLKTFSLCLSKLPSLDDATLIVFSKVLLEKMPNLESFSLQVGGTKVSNEGLNLFSSSLSKVTKNMKFFELYIDSTRVTDTGLKILAEKVLPDMSKLESLSLYFTHLQVTDVGIGRILNSLPRLIRHLKSLDLSLYDTKITNESLKVLSDNYLGNKPCLETLKLYFGQNQHISGTGFEKLFVNNSFMLKRLKHLTLNIEHTRISQSSLKKLKDFIQQNPSNLQELFIEIEPDCNSRTQSVVDQIMNLIS